MPQHDPHHEGRPTPAREFQVEVKGLNAPYTPRRAPPPAGAQLLARPRSRPTLPADAPTRRVLRCTEAKPEEESQAGRCGRPA